MRALALALALAVVLIAGCGGDDDDDDASEPVDTATTVADDDTDAESSVVVYGDSLTYEAWGAVEAAAAGLGYEISGEGIPGEALCDVIPLVEALDSPPATLIVAYVGNSNTPCTEDLSGDALADNYQDAAEELADLAEQLVLVGPPDMDNEEFTPIAPLVRERYQLVAEERDNVTFVDGRTWLSPGGYTESLPCRPEEFTSPECVDGMIPVRDEDGVHLAEPGGDVRWADAIVSGLVDDDETFGLPPLPPIATFVPPGALDAIGESNGGPVAVFGDSLTVQAQGYLDAITDAQGREITLAAYGGAALCDWRPAIEETIAAGAITQLVLAFAGNNITPCVAFAQGEELVAIYREDAEAIVDLAAGAGVAVTVVGPPDMGVEPEATHAAMLREMFGSLEGVTYVDASTALSPDGFAAALPCLLFETAEVGCNGGAITVRDDDGVHLAPPNDLEYSSGAWRYAAVLLGA